MVKVWKWFLYLFSISNIDIKFLNKNLSNSNNYLNLIQLSINVEFERDISDVQVLKDYFDENTAKAVGERAFDRMLGMAKKSQRIKIKDDILSKYQP